MLGVGAMGADHVRRIGRIPGAAVAAVYDPDPRRAHLAADWAVSMGHRSDVAATDLVAADVASAIAVADAVLVASPSGAHATHVEACLDLGIPVLCEKPLTPDVASTQRIAQRDNAALVHVGFMRRFDPDVRAMHAFAGPRTALLLHCVHRNRWAPSDYDPTRALWESVVHEIDTARYVLGAEIAGVTVLRAGDPMLVLLESDTGVLIDVECFVRTGLDYQVRAELVCAEGTFLLGADQATPDYRQRFATAYDEQLTQWVRHVRDGVPFDGATTADALAAARVCDAAVRALDSGQRVVVRN